MRYHPGDAYALSVPFFLEPDSTKAALTQFSTRDPCLEPPLVSSAVVAMCRPTFLHCRFRKLRHFNEIVHIGPICWQFSSMRRDKDGPSRVLHSCVKGTRLAAQQRCLPSALRQLELESCIGPRLFASMWRVRCQLFLCYLLLSSQAYNGALNFSGAFI